MGKSLRDLSVDHNTSKKPPRVTCSDGETAIALNARPREGTDETLIECLKGKGVTGTRTLPGDNGKKVSVPLQYGFIAARACLRAIGGELTQEDKDLLYPPETEDADPAG